MTVDLSNCSQNFGVEGTSLSGAGIHLKEVLRELVSSRAYPPSVTHLLGQLTLLTALLHGSFKFKGILSIQINGHGPIRQLLCDMTEKGHLRALAKFDEEADLSTPYPLKDLLGEGVLLLSIDPEEGKRYQGLVDLKGETLAASLEHYFNQSVQSPTRILLELPFPKDELTWKGGALLLQQHSDDFSETQLKEQWETAQFILETISPEDLSNLSLEELFYRLFNEWGVRAYPCVSLKAQCRCSRERFQKAADQAFGKDGKHFGQVSTSVSCDFCGREYDILIPQERKDIL